ncbi:MAG: HAMP domain-containing histidine kinase [Bacteroidales bacterium]|nr:HAMP domain-containing histidine kinase [Bacteroidales bacterium]
MKSQFLIWLSALALLVLIAVQYIFITETYRTKKDQFDTKFGGLVKDGMIAFNNQDFKFGLDSVLYVLDNLAVDYLFSDPDTLDRSPAQSFQEILMNYRDPEIFLRDHIRKAGEDPVFTYYLQINELFLLDMGFEQQVYPDTIPLPVAPDEALLAGSYNHERNFFRISYDIYINFTNRSRLILNEMWLILALAILTLLLVFTVFYITLRNMLLQKRLSDMKTDFINNMTHELKTPLSTISVASSSLGNRSIIQQEEKVEELSKLIKRQNRHLSELIDRILDINIWEKDQVKLKPEHIHIEGWIRELVDAFSLEQGNASPVLDLQVEIQVETLLLDRVHMSTVINNLLSNAVKYGRSPCRITVNVNDKTGFLSISVTDNGPGIKKEELKHIFEKFYRGQESKQRVIKGLGLGLFYVKQIVEAHEGTITVHSNPGKGAQFNIKIPIENGLIIG